MTERPDCKNVNNWHWVEKNATPWSRERLTSLLIGSTFGTKDIQVTLNEFKKIEGDATANNRKAKLIFLFDWVLEIKFTAKVNNSDKEYTGFIEIPNLSDEYDAGEIDLVSTIETRGPNESQIRLLLSKEGLEFVRKQLTIYIRELKEEFSKGIILPTDKPQVVIKGGSTRIDKRSFQNQVVVDTNSISKPTGPVDVSFFEISDSFKVQPERLYEILTQPELVKAWASSDSIIEPKEGSNFVFFGGQITGQILKMEMNSSISIKWRLRDYPAGHYANINFILTDQDNCTGLTIRAEQVPVAKLDETREGFNRHYLRNIGQTFGCGLRLF